MLKLIIQISMLMIFIQDAFAGQLSVDAAFVDRSCTEYFGVVSFDFSNETGSWLTVESVGVSFGKKSTDDNVAVVTGAELESWNDGIRNKQRKDLLNQRLLLGTIAVLGASSGKSTNTSLGRVAASTLAISEIAQYKDRVKSQYGLARSHLLSGEFLIPPGMMISKWIVFGTESSNPVPYVSSIVLSATLKNGSKFERKINLRDMDEEDDNGCIWQSKQRPVGTEFD